MSRQSSSRKGEQQMDEKVVLVAEGSHLKPALASPPSFLYPSSSSSSVPPTSHDPSHLNVASASSSGDPFAAQIAQLFNLVGRLSSENEALKAQAEAHSSRLDAHSSTNSRLSCENEELRRRFDGMERTMKEMSKAFGDHWIWEAGGKEGGETGRWTWSGEKYKPTSLQLAGSKPPPSLDSIPVELFNSIASLLDLSDHLSLCGVSFRILELASTFVYTDRLALDSKTAATFLGPRTTNFPPSPNRISPLLLPPTLRLEPFNFNASHFLPLANGRPLTLNSVSLFSHSSATLKEWSPLLAVLNPVEITIIGRGRTDVSVGNAKPTALLVGPDELSFLPAWTRLEIFAATGCSAVHIFADGTFALSRCLRRCTPEADVSVVLVSLFHDERKNEEEIIVEGQLPMVLAREISQDPTRRALMITAMAG